MTVAVIGAGQAGLSASRHLVRRSIDHVVLGIGGLEQAGVTGFFITVSLTQDFLAPVPLGAWLEAEVKLLRRTRNTMFVQGVFRKGGEPALRASGVFRLPRPDG